MVISNVSIENFKSINKIDIPFDKVGNSYTKIFVGINESGKSNILEALSYYDVPEEDVSFDQFCNQKLENSESCDINFSLGFEDEEEETLQIAVNDAIKTEIANFSLNFSLVNITKKVFLSKGASRFESYFDYDVELDDSILYVKTSKSSGQKTICVSNVNDLSGEFEKLDSENFIDFFDDVITQFFSEHEPLVSIWKPSSEYLLYSADLNSFKDRIKSNKPLYNIFRLSGYVNKKAIVDIIEKVRNPRSRSRLESKLNESLNDYIGKVWSNNIDLIIEITETGNFSLLIKDKGNENKHDRFSITERSEGAQHFLSLILSLSLETKNHERKNELILIDEPEVHLHPSGIRDLAKELLKIGQDNYVFLATHSPFMIDKEFKERHFIVQKNKKATTEIKRIKDSDNLIDDEVLRQAFGIDVYRDLLNPHSILVEGAADKLILQKTLSCLGHSNFGITNGHGSNITTLVSKLNYDNIHILVILDDDQDGRKDKDKILKIGGAYNERNVFTIRDLVGELVDKGTIEDTLDLSFVKSVFKKFYKKTFGGEIEVDLIESEPVIKQISELLKSKKQFNKWDMDSFKKQLSEEFRPTKHSLDTKNKLLKKLADKIVDLL